MKSKQRIFDSIEHLKHEYNLNVEIPKDIPEGCNVISWEVSNKPDMMFYREGEELCYWGKNRKYWYSVGGGNLEQEVFDDIQNGYDYVYLRLATKDSSDVFTSERLLGAETTQGFVTCVFKSEYTGRLFINATNCRNLLVSEVEYYISDTSDETVSFEEYVRIFYEE